MTRPTLRLTLVSLLLAGGLLAQDRPLPTGAVPIVTAALSDLAGEVGGAATTVDLRGHLSLDTERSSFVRFDTTFGEFDVEMLPDHAPLHVANFLTYLSEAAYTETIIHRTSFFDTEDDLPEIVQGGGYKVSPALDPIINHDPVVLEYSYPNARGTLGAARTAEENSATSQWYFNTSDNSGDLGESEDSGKYTVFAKVVGSGMAVVDTLGQINTFYYSALFSELPLRFYSGGTPTAENFVTIHSVTELPLYPSSADEAAVLNFSATSSDDAVAAVSVSGSTLTITPGVAGDATITVTASTISEDVASTSFVFSTGGLVISTHPASQTVAPGGSATFSVVAPAATGTNTYQWYFYRAGMSAPAAIAGATGASHTASEVGFYFVDVTNGSETLRSDAAVLTTTDNSSRLANLSTRGRITAGGSLTPGFVLSGDGSKPLLVRGVGPQLIEFGLSAGLADPTLDIIPQGGSAAAVSNDNWGDATNAAELPTAFASVGAFGLTSGSLDATVLASFDLPNSQGNRGYTARIESTDTDATGIALAEVYDTDLSSTQRLVNVSALGFSGTGIDALTPGFVISGSGSKTMLIRVVGPSLATFGVGGTMADPKLRVVPLGQDLTVAANDNWSGAADLKAAFTTTGAFQFSGDASLDAAVLVRLPAGGYTVVVEDASGGTGVVLVEAYEVQ